MPSLFDSLLKISSNLVETGLLVADSALRTVQAGIGSLAGPQSTEPPTAPPIPGPQNLDLAISDLANRTARIVRFTPFEIGHAPKAWAEWIEAARRSFVSIDWKDPKNLLLPAQIPLSVGTMFTGLGLRALSSFEIVGSKRYPVFLSNVFEMFTEAQST